jgi:hypothetical protein
MPLERGSCFNSSGTMPGALTSGWGAMRELYPEIVNLEVVTACVPQPHSH